MDPQLINVLTIVTCGAVIARRRRKSVRKVWMKEWHERRSAGKGLLTMLNEELLLEDLPAYTNFLRFKPKLFDEILRHVALHIAKQNTNMRESISARNRLEVTFRFLATGDSYRSLMYSTRIHESTISLFIPEVCDAIIQTLKGTYLKTPQTMDEWQGIADGFSNLWQFPHCIGALDGRHITFKAPRSAGSYYYNYKGDNSVVLLALVDAYYKFIYVNIGVNGRVSDGGVFRESNLSKRLANNSFDLPLPQSLPGCTKPVPYVIVADDAFPLTSYLLKPYPQRNVSYEKRIFNYRLSRARRIVENAFGQLANRFRVLLNPINLSPDKVETITMTCVVLHNFLKCNDECNEESFKSNKYNDGCNSQPRLNNQQGPNRPTSAAMEIRDEFKLYFSSVNGKVDWQDDAIKNFNT